MTTQSDQVDAAARRCRVLLDALKSLIECSQIVEEDSTQLASCLFLVVELEDAIEKLSAVPSVKPANEA